ncbi:4-hydroxy-3-methylbut-2-enyl diphosphate reductase [Psittacicella hinzii]|uniref:4-hydroxy-3-methylbut-2-enyl diphosphate reductase n=1 Tax=Psittacicella hinzii TaxID=2028575 RepID=A0A3A1YG46_9GAMM|nr:4-hydroxy-3-methylbut-2-enyl diphosphate reductase [Psittacicella hinzii]RIY35017.1 4-hydroxy-3-methylbut-2-enyl diphosphate reductase [Psittacicella hinzii]
MEIILANPRGFCAGVDRAISIVNLALENFDQPIYVRHEVVHNRYVVDDLKTRGAIFVEELDEVPDHSIVIFSAHGVSQAVRQEARTRQLTVFDATCPLVTKVHMQVSRAARKGVNAILIGHAGHPEVIGTMGQYVSDTSKMYLVENVADVEKLELDPSLPLVYMTQTTLSLDDTKEIIVALKEKFPHIEGPRKDDICYATTNRQNAVRDLATQVDILFVVGSKNSSNSSRLAELGNRLGTKSYLIDGMQDVQLSWLEGVQKIGITAGASAPDILVHELIAFLEQNGVTKVSNLKGLQEDVFFQVPKELRIKDITE